MSREDGRIEDLTSPDRAERAAAFPRVLSRVWREGRTRAEAEAVVPQLAALLEDPNVSNRGRIALMLGLIAEGDEGASRAAVRQNIPIFTRLLRDEVGRDPPLRHALLYLLSQFKEEKETLVGEVLSLLPPKHEDRSHFRNAVDEPDFAKSTGIHLELLDSDRSISRDPETLRRVWNQFRLHAIAYLGARADFATRDIS